MTQKNTGRSFTQSCFPKGFTCPSSSRNVLVRDIGADNTLYPALQACGVTARVGRGFTLIELLVVVLIIGILAAVALPQYQKAVQKSRIATMLPMLKSLVTAQKEAVLSTGNFASLNDLVIDISQSKISLPGYGTSSIQNFWQAGRSIADLESGKMLAWGYSYIGPNQPSSISIGVILNKESMEELLFCYAGNTNWCPKMGFSKKDTSGLSVSVGTPIYLMEENEVP